MNLTLTIFSIPKYNLRSEIGMWNWKGTLGSGRGDGDGIVWLGGRGG